MSTVDIKVTGMREFQAGVKEAAAGADDALDVVVAKAAELVMERARRGVPTRSGRARRSVHLTRTTAGVGVVAGGSVAPYFPWLDYGGRVGRGKSVLRVWRPEGRYVFPALRAERAEILRMLDSGLEELLEDAGLGVT